MSGLPITVMPKVTARKANQANAQQAPEADDLNLKPSKSETTPSPPQATEEYDSDDYIDLNNPRPPARMIELFFNRNKCTFLDLCLHDYRMEIIRGGENLEAVKQDIYERYRRIWPMDGGRSLRFNHIPAPYWAGPPQRLCPLREVSGSLCINLNICLPCVAH